MAKTAYLLVYVALSGRMCPSHLHKWPSVNGHYPFDNCSEAGLYGRKTTVNHEFYINTWLKSRIKEKQQRKQSKQGRHTTAQLTFHYS